MGSYLTVVCEQGGSDHRLEMLNIKNSIRLDGNFSQVSILENCSTSENSLNLLCTVRLLKTCPRHVPSYHKTHFNE